MKQDRKPTGEELRRELQEKLASGYFFQYEDEEPKAEPVVTVPVSEKIAAAVRANPESVRISARSAEDIHVVEGPRVERPRARGGVTVRVDWVSEVDANGQAGLAKGRGGPRIQPAGCVAEGLVMPLPVMTASSEEEAKVKVTAAVEAVGRGERVNVRLGRPGPRLRGRFLFCLQHNQRR